MTTQTKAEMTTEAAWAFLEALPAAVKQHDQDLRDLIAQGRVAAAAIEGEDQGGFNVQDTLAGLGETIDGTCSRGLAEVARILEVEVDGMRVAHGNRGAFRVWVTLAVYKAGMESLNDSGPALEFFGRLKTIHPEVAEELIGLDCYERPGRRGPSDEELATAREYALAAISELTAVSA
ncbi:MAG TPA: hypothetical protein VMV09_02110 [Candidatus Saccharimonadales bacterium]|nr:hypothetical protein [Candidatus Saccharimonadales bacterium]